MADPQFSRGDLVWFDPGIGYVLPGEVTEFHPQAQVRHSDSSELKKHISLDTVTAQSLKTYIPGPNLFFMTFRIVLE